MTFDKLIKILRGELGNDTYDLKVENSTVTILGETIGNCYTEDDEDDEGFEMDSLYVFDLVLNDKSERFVLNEIFTIDFDELTVEEMIHTVLTSLVDEWEENNG